MSKSVTVKAAPRFTSSGARSGYEVVAGSQSMICKTLSTCQTNFRATITNYLKAGYSVTADVYDAKGRRTHSTRYSVKKDGSVTQTAAKISPQRPPKAKPTTRTAKKTSAKKTSAKKTTAKKSGKQNQGLKRYAAYIKGAQSKGLSLDQARAAWAKITTKPTTIAAAKKAGESAKKSGPARKTPSAKTTAVRKKAPAKKKSTAKKSTTKRAPAKKTSTGLPKLGAAKTSAKKAPAKKSAAKKSAAKKAPAKTSAKTSAKKAPTKKKASRKPSAYNLFIKKFMASHPVDGYRGSSPAKKNQARMAAAAAAWQKQKK